MCSGEKNGACVFDYVRFCTKFNPVLLTVSIFKTAKGATTFYLFTTVQPANAVSVAVTSKQS